MIYIIVFFIIGLLLGLANPFIGLVVFFMKDYLEQIGLYNIAGYALGYMIGSTIYSVKIFKNKCGEK